MKNEEAKIKNWMDNCKDKIHEYKKMKEDSKKLNKEHKKLKHNEEVANLLKLF